MNAEFELIRPRDIDNSRVEPRGDPSVRYPQISIRTNRTPGRTALDFMIEKANKVADQYPNKRRRAKAVLNAIARFFKTGDIGHSWINIYHSEKEDDYTAYAYHWKYGFVRNNEAPDVDDRNSRGFSVQYCAAIDNDTIAIIEESVIPVLNAESVLIGSAMGAKPTPGYEGVYTRITNCTWFTGKLWNAVMDEPVVYTQKLDGKAYAKRWGIDALFLVNEIADPGILAECLDASARK